MGATRAVNGELRVSGEEPPGGADVWRWSAFADWRTDILALVGDLVTEPVIAAFRAKRPEGVDGGDVEWLNRIVRRVVDNRPVDVRETLAARLRTRFQFVRAFHAQKVVDVQSVYRDGLKPIDHEALVERARAVFAGLDGGSVDPVTVSTATDLIDPAVIDSELRFDLRVAPLILAGKDRQVEGESFLIAVANALPQERDYGALVRGLEGRQTIYACDVPLTALDRQTIGDLASLALAMIFNDLIENRPEPPDERLPTGFSIHGPLAADMVVGHCHPGLGDRPIDVLSWAVTAERS